MNVIQPNNDQTLYKAPKSIWKRILLRFSLIYLLIIAFITVFIAIFYNGYTKTLEKELLLSEEPFIASTTQALQKEMHIQLMTMQMVSRSKVLGDFLEKGKAESQTGLEQLFINLALTFKSYDQIRLIGLDGNERIRVNYEAGQATVVKQQYLQNKKYSTYFSEAIQLSVGNVYVSAMELNVEYGEIEIPHKPVVRFVTPIADSQGKVIGLLAINYLATELLQNFRAKMELRKNGQGMLIDPRGYWISNHDRSNEWGGSLGDVDEKFEDMYPEAWPTIKANQDGIFKSKKGLFRYVSINPFTLDSISQYKKASSSVLTVTEESKRVNDWRLIIYIPNDIVHQQSFFHSRIGYTALVALLFTSAIILLLILLMIEQKRRQRAIDRTISLELSDLYENAPCGYHSLDENGAILKMNQTELSWLGYQREEVIGKPFTDFLTPDSISTFQAFLSQLKSDKQIKGIVLEIQSKHGHTFFVSSSATCILDHGIFASARTSVFDISDRIRLENRLVYIANTDVLTGINNRRHFFEQANEVFQTENDISVLMLDADKFKNINDQYGHDIGDVVLKMISSTLKSSVPDGAILARLGGEEFVILLANLDSESALQLSQTICDTIANTPIKIDEEIEINVTISIGTAQRQNYEEDIDSILKRADEALYQAKSTGRNKVVQATR
jgi:diguanylate cyclase (GGDEF)-like protein/PAS domain S-box-containing protein